MLAANGSDRHGSGQGDRGLNYAAPLPYRSCLMRQGRASCAARQSWKKAGRSAPRVKVGHRLVARSWARPGPLPGRPYHRCRRRRRRRPCLPRPPPGLLLGQAPPPRLLRMPPAVESRRARRPTSHMLRSGPERQAAAGRFNARRGAVSFDPAGFGGLGPPVSGPVTGRDPPGCRASLQGAGDRGGGPPIAGERVRCVRSGSNSAAPAPKLRGEHVLQRQAPTHQNIVHRLAVQLSALLPGCSGMRVHRAPHGAAARVALQVRRRRATGLPDRQVFRSVPVCAGAV